MGSKKALWLLVGILSILLVAGLLWYSGHDENQDSSTLLLYGNVDIREVDLTFNNSEHIDTMQVEEGDRVRAGQLLATLHAERHQAELNAAQAQVESRRAALARLETGSRPEEIRQARANVAAARAKLADAEVTYARTSRLSKERAASHQAVDDAQAALDTAQADLKVAEEALALAVEGPRIEDIEEARALLKAAEAQVALAQEVLKDTELFAPADGIIRNRILQPGDMASPQKPVMTLALTNPVWVRTYVPENALGKLTPGMSAEVSTDSYPGKRYPGWVGFISPTAEFTPKNVETPELRTRLVYQVRVFVCNPEDELRLGMPATVTIPLDGEKPGNVHKVPDCTRGGDD